MSKAKRRQLRLKLKRRAAALMGTAIIAGAALAGIPTTKAFAAETVSNPHQVKIVQAQDVKDSRPPGRGWHEHKRSWPSANENQIWYQDGKVYYRSDNHRNYYDYWNHGKYAYYVNSPVDYLKDNAASYGFNSARDSFSLLTVNSKRALVEVRKHDTGRLYNVLLERTDTRDWIVVNVRAL